MFIEYYDDDIGILSGFNCFCYIGLVGGVNFDRGDESGFVGLEFWLFCKGDFIVFIGRKFF